MKIKLLIDQVIVLKEEITECLNNLGKPYSRITIKGGKPTIADGSFNRSLISKLKLNNYISSYKKEDAKLRVYTKRK